MLMIGQRFQVIWIFPFQRNFSFVAVYFADEKHLLSDTNVIGTVKSLITNFSELGAILQYACNY